MRSIRPVLRVTDMDEALAFYQDGLGFTIRAQGETRAWVELQRADVTLALYDASVLPFPPGPSLFVIFVGDLDEIWAELRRRDTDVTEIGGSEDDRYRDFETEDPSGNIIIISEEL